MQPTASKSALLIQCSYPFNNERLALTQEEPGPEAEYGTLFHLWMAKSIAAGEHVPSGDPELDKHVKKSYAKLEGWLNAHHYAKQWTLVEYPMAYHPESGVARKCEPTNEEHHYPDLRFDEIAGTADMIVMPTDKSRAILILDHKTGMYGDFSRPERIPQLITLALAACSLFQRTKFVLAVLHTPKDGIPIVYSSEEIDIDDDDIRLFDTALRRAVYRIRDGSLRPGDECKFCPARDQCPAQVRNLFERAAELVEKANLVGSELMVIPNDGKRSKEESMGRLHLLLSRFRELDKRASAELKRELTEDPCLEPVRPDGKVLALVHRDQQELLSKSTILRALGKTKGEELIQKLRDMGCTEYVEREELRAK